VRRTGRAYRVDHRLPQTLRALAEQIGSMRAGPRDVIELHSAALREKTAGAPPRKAQAFVDEANVMVLELMGYLASHYRALSGFGGRVGPIAAPAAARAAQAGVPARLGA